MEIRFENGKILSDFEGLENSEKSKFQKYIFRSSQYLPRKPKLALSDQ